MKEFKITSCKEWLHILIEISSFNLSHANLRIYKVKNIILILEDSLSNFVIFNNGGGDVFDIMIEKDNLKADNLLKFAQSERFSSLVYCYRINGKDTLNSTHWLMNNNNDQKVRFVV